MVQNNLIRSRRVCSDTFFHFMLLADNRLLRNKNLSIKQSIIAQIEPSITQSLKYAATQLQVWVHSSVRTPFDGGGGLGKLKEVTGEKFCY